MHACTRIHAHIHTHTHTHTPISIRQSYFEKSAFKGEQINRDGSGEGTGDKAWERMPFRMGDPRTRLYDTENNLKEQVTLVKQKKG